MKIIFFCPPPSVINGGIKHIFRMAEALIAEGHDAAVFEQNGQRPTWFSSSAPVVGQGVFSTNADHIYVLPEDQPRILADFAKFPQRKIIYSQNHFYGALGVMAPASYSDFGVSDVLCSSQTIYEHCRIRHPKTRAHVVPCSIDGRFRPGTEKEDAIAFMPRKRPLEAAYIRDMFRFSYPQYQNWAWREISNVSEDEAAKIMGGARVFLSLSRLEGFGLTPLEAMAAGCVVAGFTGIGGREYATLENGYWANEDDFPACIEGLAKAVAESLSGDEKHAKARAETRSRYTPENFKRGVMDAWNKILV